MECSFCKKRFATKKELAGHYATCSRRRAYIDDVLTLEFLQSALLTRSANSIAEDLHESIHAGTVIQRAKLLGISTHSIRSSTNLHTVRTQAAITNIARYGAPNTLSRGTPGYQKRNDTVLQKYGVSNVFRDSGVKAKITATMIAKYGVTNNAYRPHAGHRRGYESNLHLYVLSILDEMGVSYESEKVGKFLKYNPIYGREYNPRPDILLEEHKLIIDVRGDFWHANPAIYKASDMIPLFRGYTEASWIWERDQSRVKQFESFGYTVCVLFERDKLNFKEQICSALKLQVLGR